MVSLTAFYLITVCVGLIPIPRMTEQLEPKQRLERE